MYGSVKIGREKRRETKWERESREGRYGTGCMEKDGKWRRTGKKRAIWAEAWLVIGQLSRVVTQAYLSVYKPRKEDLRTKR
jgi:hypothetical protein